MATASRWDRFKALEERLRKLKSHEDPNDVVASFFKENGTLVPQEESERSFTPTDDEDDNLDDEENDVVTVAIPEKVKQIRLASIDEQYNFVVTVLSDVADKLHFDFDYKSASLHILQGKACVGVGETQSGKTQMLSVVALCSLVQNRPTVYLGCDVMANVEVLGKKLQNMFDIINSHSHMLQSKFNIHLATLANNPKVNTLRFLVDNKDKISRGLMPIMISYTANQIERVDAVLKDYSLKPPNMVMDEADKFWSTSVEWGEDYVLEGIKREKVFYRLLGPKQEEFPGIHSIFQITATPFDCIAWHMNNNVPLRGIALDKEICRTVRGYVGVEKLKPLCFKRQQVFLETGQISKKNGYGMEDPIILGMYNEVEKLRRNGHKGLFLIDISNPLVYVDGNTEDRARFFSKKYRNWVFLVIRGDGVHRFEDDNIVQVVNFRKKRSLEMSNEMFASLSEVLTSYDDSLRTPICLIGYTMIKRSLSARSNLRVPSHMIVAPSLQTSLADLIQMLGRSLGKNAPILRANRFEAITVLMYENDWQAALQYDDFMRDVLAKLGTGKVEDLRTLAKNKFPSAFRPVMDSGRRLGNPRLNTTVVMKEEIHFDEESEGESDDEVDGWRRAFNDIKRKVLDIYASSGKKRLNLSSKVLQSIDPQLADLMSASKRWPLYRMAELGYLKRTNVHATWEVLEKGLKEITN